MTNKEQLRAWSDEEKRYVADASGTKYVPSDPDTDGLIEQRHPIVGYDYPNLEDVDSVLIALDQIVNSWRNAPITNGSTRSVLRMCAEDLEILIRPEVRKKVLPPPPPIILRCPTLCDDDCEATCHETHQVSWKRHHPIGQCLVPRNH